MTVWNQHNIYSFSHINQNKHIKKIPPLWRNKFIVTQLQQWINCVTIILFLVIVYVTSWLFASYFSQKSCKFWILKSNSKLVIHYLKQWKVWASTLILSTHSFPLMFISTCYCFCARPWRNFLVTFWFHKIIPFY